MTWKVTFYSEKVEQQTLALPPGILANLLRIIELIEEFGPDLGRRIQRRLTTVYLKLGQKAKRA
jgi:hypothetical protein